MTLKMKKKSKFNFIIIYIFKDSKYMTKTFKNLICKNNIENFIMMEEIKHNHHFKFLILQRVAEKRKNKIIFNNL